MRYLPIALLFLVPTLASAQSTSPNPGSVSVVNRGVPAPSAGPNAAAPVITFSEFSIGTAITDQYLDRGIVFGGSNPFISPDGSNPTSPVLSGTPLFSGPIEGSFVAAGTTTPAVVESFTLDAGYFDSFGSTRIQWFDPTGRLLGQRINSKLGIERLTITGGNIAKWRIEVVANEPAGYAIDNVTSVPAGASVLFRELTDSAKEGTWGFAGDDIPGFDHSAFQIGNVVYESHPAYPSGTYVSADGQESKVVSAINGVQSQHSKATFAHDSTTSSSHVTTFEEVPIPDALAAKMKDAIETKRGATFQFIDYSLSGLAQTLAPAVQKGGGGSFTCVGLVEWAAEQAGHNSGQGFIPSRFESFMVPDFRTLPPGQLEIPLLSPQLLNYAMKGQDVLQGATQWIQGLLDPVDFVITDPLGRRLGFVQGVGRFNEIPHAYYSGDGKIEHVLIPLALPGAYKLELFGKGEHTFSALESKGSRAVVSEMLAVGQSREVVVALAPQRGSMGDVDGDGDVDSSDVTALRGRVTRFTDGLDDPGDLNGDGLLSLADVTLLQRLVDPLPVAGSDSFATESGTPLVVPAPGVLGNDTGTAPFSAALVSTVAHGTLALNADGSFTYTPTAGFVGVDSFNYLVSDLRGASNPATVTLIVNPPKGPQPPSGLQVAAVVGNSVTFRWTPPVSGPAPTGYVFEAGIFSGQVLASLPLGPVPSFTVKAPPGSYFVRVRTRVGTDTSATSGEIQAHVGVAVAPSSPANLLGTTDGNALTLAWTNTYGGAAPTGLVLDVSGAVNGSFPIGFADTFRFAGVPPGTYTFRVRAANSAGISSPSSAVTLSFPGSCAAPQPPANFAVFNTGSTALISWDLPPSGTAPDRFVLNVSGSFTGSVPLDGRSLTAQVPPGTYQLRLGALNACGTSAPTPVRTLVVP